MEECRTPAYVTALMTGAMGQGYSLNSITTPDPATPDNGTKVTLTSSELINRLNSRNVDAGTGVAGHRAIRPDQLEPRSGECVRGFAVLRVFKADT